MEMEMESKKNRKERVILTSPMPLMLPVIKIVGDWCNLKCTYCFYYTKDQSRKTIMRQELLEKFIKEYLNLFKRNIRFTWHGGEPLLAGIEFFQEIINLEKRYKRKGQQILNTVQTNGTLINDKWASFFKENDFKIGVSLDGIELCHNMHRKNKNGIGSFRKTVKGIKKLKEYGVPVSILSVATRSCLPYIERNLFFFVHDLKVKSIAMLPYFPNDNELMKKEMLNNEDVEELYKRVINFWIKTDDARFKIREVDNFIAGVLGKQATLCSFGGTCTGFFCLDYDGKIYPCDRLSSNPRFCWGNLYNQPLVEILNSKKRLEYANSVNNLPEECRKCKWKNACHNGCPALRQKNGKYQFCKARKRTFLYIEKILKDHKVI